MTRLWRATALVLALTLTLTLGVWVPARADFTPDMGETAGKRMLGLQLLKGKSPDDILALQDEITRAELVTVIVRAFGQEDAAKTIAGAPSFPDVQGHWAAGSIAMAKALVEKAGGDAIGLPDGSFEPNGKLTPAQAVAFLMKFLGVKADATKTWPANYLDAAVEAGIITDADMALITPLSNDNATRGLVFYLFDRAFSSYDLGDGKTPYTRYVDPSGPVLTVNQVRSVTTDSAVTVSGRVVGATQLTVANQPVSVDADGYFTVQYPLPEPGTYTISLVARDLAGNQAEAQRTVTRTAVLADIAVEPAQAHVEIGASIQFRATGRDMDGKPIDLGPVVWEATAGTIDGNGMFTATTAGPVTVTASVFAPGAMHVAGAAVSVAGGPAALRAGTVPALTANGHDRWTLSVAVVDANGTTVPSSQAPVTVRVAEGAGLSVNGGTEATVPAEGGVAIFTLQATTTVTDAGRLLITAGGLTGTEVSYRTVAPAPARIVLQAGSAALYAGGSTTVTVRVEDHYGNPASVAAPTRVLIGGASISDVTIPAGASETSFTVRAGQDASRVTLTASAEDLGSTSLTLQVERRSQSGIIDGERSCVVQIDGVFVTADIRDTTGAPVTGLTEADFTFHDGPEQIPFQVSGATYDSMTGTYILMLSDSEVGVAGSYTLTVRVRGVQVSGTIDMTVVR